MVAFARARTRTLFSRLWPSIIKSEKTDRVVSEKAQTQAHTNDKQNKRFLEITKNGGIWFS